MQDPFCDFLCPPLIPELRTKITAGTAAYIHFPLIPIAAVRTFPEQLALFFNDLYFTVKATFLTVVGFCIQFSISDIQNGYKIQISFVNLQKTAAALNGNHYLSDSKTAIFRYMKA